MSNTIERIQGWFFSNCNEVWEHSYGVTIENCDNPGWLVTVDLEETYLQDIKFKTVEYQKSNDDDWIHCKKEGFKFKAAGGPKKLDEILIVFLNWADKYEAQST